MELGFVGSPQEWHQINSHFRPDSSHRFVAAFLESAERPGELQPTDHAAHPLPFALRQCSTFEELLTDTQVDALILGGALIQRPERLRRIAQFGRHCLCFHPADLNSIFYHEVAMIAADGRSVLMPWLAARMHDGSRSLQSLLRDGRLGAVRLVTIERASHKPMDQTLLAVAYAEVADLLGWLIGDCIEVTATGDPASGRLVVQHKTESGIAAEIRLTPLPLPSDRWTVTVEGDLGTAELSLEYGITGGGTLRWSAGAEKHHAAIAASPFIERLLEQFGLAVKGEPHTPTWGQAIQAAELADAARLSLERRRAVDVYHEKRNELASFKGRMTSLGCGLIWFTLTMLIAVAAGKGLHIPGMEWLGAATVLLWIIFLGLQTLRWVLPK